MEGASSANDSADPSAIFRALLHQTKEVYALFGRTKELCGFEISERAQRELQRKGSAFELVGREQTLVYLEEELTIIHYVEFRYIQM